MVADHSGVSAKPDIIIARTWFGLHCTNPDCLEPGWSSELCGVCDTGLELVGMENVLMEDCKNYLQEHQDFP